MRFSLDVIFSRNFVVRIELLLARPTIEFNARMM